MTVKNQQEPVSPVVIQAMELAIGICEFKRDGRFANSGLQHRRAQYYGTARFRTSVWMEVKFWQKTVPITASCTFSNRPRMA